MRTFRIHAECGSYGLRGAMTAITRIDSIPVGSGVLLILDDLNAPTCSYAHENMMKWFHNLKPV